MSVKSCKQLGGLCLQQSRTGFPQAIQAYEAPATVKHDTRRDANAGLAIDTGVLTVKAVKGFAAGIAGKYTGINVNAVTGKSHELASLIGIDQPIVGPSKEKFQISHEITFF